MLMMVLIHVDDHDDADDHDHHDDDDDGWMDDG